MPWDSASNWKKLLFTVFAALLLMAIALLEFSVLGPKRLEDDREARRNSPPKLVPPSARPAGAIEPDKVTAFRKEEWRFQESPSAGFSPNDPAGSYLSGYIKAQEGQKLWDEGDLNEARLAFQEAARTFDLIKTNMPDFEAEILDYRRNKVAESLAALKN